MRLTGSSTQMEQSDTREGSVPAGPQSRANLLFLRGFLHNPTQVGSVMPSSKLLEERVVRCAKVSAAKTVVELGPGTGGITCALLAAMRIDSSLLALELDKAFVGHLETSLHDARLLVANTSAENLEALLEAHGLGAPAAIVSGIPFSTMPPSTSHRIADCIAQVLPVGGRFVAYQLRGHVTRYLTPRLGEPETMEWELLNVPPMRVSTWVKHG